MADGPTLSGGDRYLSQVEVSEILEEIGVDPKVRAAVDVLFPTDGHGVCSQATVEAELRKGGVNVGDFQTAIFIRDSDAIGTLDDSIDS